ncbi:outer membrane beta-barrel protein [Roseateles sp. LYH14W]|uniref:Outer membrane beta-barrel protein n=1 Tax=Pelomonas parva TaxID=3299032 RepID=A0ABW7EWL9_9BURK
MKKHAIILAAVLAATAAHADQQAHGYIGTAGGATHINLDCTGATSCDASDTGAKLFGGYNFGNGFSLEASYMAFGKFKGADGTMSLTIKPTAIALGAGFALPLSTDWGMNFRLGVARVKTQASATVGAASGSQSESKAKVYAGLGVAYAISNTVKLELGVDTTEAQFAGEKGTLRLVSLAASFAF